MFGGSGGIHQITDDLKELTMFEEQDEEVATDNIVTSATTRSKTMTLLRQERDEARDVVKVLQEQVEEMGRRLLEFESHTNSEVSVPFLRPPRVRV